MKVKTEIIISPLKTKKYRMNFYKGDALLHHTDFGARRYEDYTTHHDDYRKERFQQRFRCLIEKDKNDPTKPMTLSDWILWRDRDLRTALRNYNKHFGFQLKK